MLSNLKAKPQTCCVWYPLLPKRRYWKSFTSLRRPRRSPLLAAAGTRLWNIQRLRVRSAGAVVPARLLRLRRLELPQLHHGGIGGSMQVMNEKRNEKTYSNHLFSPHVLTQVFQHKDTLWWVWCRRLFLMLMRLSHFLALISYSSRCCSTGLALINLR